MQEDRSYRRALLPFYLMVVYVLLQFFWWAYLILMQTGRIYSDNNELRRRWIMIGGEGAVFLALMVIGIYRVQRSFRKEGELLARQRTFLHSITHEFKSPVASLRLQLETLLKRNLTGEQQHASLNNALEDTDRLNELLEKILVAARIDNGELPLHPKPTDISLLLKECVEKVSRVNPARKIECRPEEGIIQNIDPWAFESIVTNLLENAVLYSSSGQPVTVALSKGKTTAPAGVSHEAAILKVMDTGIGIPAAEKDKIFSKFYRLNSSGGYKGTGLGLYLTNYLVKKSMGYITVKDNMPQGTIFEVVFQGSANEN